MNDTTPKRATAQTEQRFHGVGEMHMRIVRLISQGFRHPKAIKPRLNEYAGTENLHSILRGLAMRGYVTEGRGSVFTLTSKAQWLLPKAELQPWQTSTYTPAKAPPRRPGSDHSHIPSVAGSQRIPYEAHV